jgi:hypothetical protein
MNLADMVAAHDKDLDPSQDDIDIQAGENVTVDKLGPRQFKVSATDTVGTGGGGGGSGSTGGTYRGQYSVELAGDAFQLVSDVASPGNSKVYGTDASGVRGWHDGASTIASGTVTGDMLYWNQTTKRWVILAKPASMSVLCCNNSGLQWVRLTSRYMVPRSDGTDVIADYVRFRN